MSPASYRLRAGVVAALTLVGAATALPGPGRAQPPAQAKLDAQYAISFARVPVGRIVLVAEVAPTRYGIAASASATGIIRVIASGDGTATTAGVIKDGRLVPVSFKSTSTHEDEKVELTMSLDNGTVKDVAIVAPPPKSGRGERDEGDRVAITEAHRQNIVDPLTAMLAAMPGNGTPLSADACRRTLPIFDGRRRFDLVLTFNRMDAVKPEKGYQGPVVVCSVVFKAIAGHRAKSRLVNYLADSRDMELWLAPVGATRVLAPVRLSLSSWIGNLVINATHFEISEPLPANSK